ncbi:hypothetical protein GAZ16_22465, partial [Bacteroides xylanisolvens]
FYRIKKEEEENRRNKKEITTKFDEEPFFQLYRGGLRIKIRVTTVSHKLNSPLCPPCPLW